METRLRSGWIKRSGKNRIPTSDNEDVITDTCVVDRNDLSSKRKRKIDVGQVGTLIANVHNYNHFFYLFIYYDFFLFVCLFVCY